jgi:membrane protein required for colicin V production
MNAIDIALIVILLLCAVRGYWRGFLRELFGLLGLALGAAAALRFTAEGAKMIEPYAASLPPPVLTGTAFVVIFVVVHTAVILVGLLFDRLAKAVFLRGINRMAGAVFAAGKGAVVMALLLFALHLFQIAELDEQIMSSTIGRPLVRVAGDLIDAAQAGQDKT